MKKKLRELAAELSVTHREFDLVTVKKRNYYVYRYEGNLNGIENAVVLLSYPEKAFGNPKALRAFISTNVALSAQEILSWYVCRWPIEVFFRQCKDKMALDGYCLHLDLKDLQRMAYLLQMCSNNLNQYAKAANENGRVYAADMEDLQQRLDELIEIGRQILSRLADL